MVYQALLIPKEDCELCFPVTRAVPLMIKTEEQTLEGALECLIQRPAAAELLLPLPA